MTGWRVGLGSGCFAECFGDWLAGRVSTESIGMGTADGSVAAASMLSATTRTCLASNGRSPVPSSSLAGTRWPKLGFTLSSTALDFQGWLSGAERMATVATVRSVATLGPSTTASLRLSLSKSNNACRRACAWRLCRAQNTLSCASASRFVAARRDLNNGWEGVAVSGCDDHASVRPWSMGSPHSSTKWVDTVCISRCSRAAFMRAMSAALPRSGTISNPMACTIFLTSRNRRRAFRMAAELWVFTSRGATAGFAQPPALALVLAWASSSPSVSLSPSCTILRAPASRRMLLSKFQRASTAAVCNMLLHGSYSGSPS